MENTKFIVTLEGVDTEIFPVKDEQLDIRSRLGVRPVQSDNLEEVEVSTVICLTLYTLDVS